MSSFSVSRARNGVARLHRGAGWDDAEYVHLAYRYRLSRKCTLRLRLMCINGGVKDKHPSCDSVLAWILRPVHVPLLLLALLSIVISLAETCFLRVIAIAYIVML